MSTYQGCHVRELFLVAVHEPEVPEPFELTPTTTIRDFASGFAWGYVGAGPHCLAFHLLLDATLAYVRDWGTWWSIASEEIETWVGIQTAREAA